MAPCHHRVMTAGAILKSSRGGSSIILGAPYHRRWSGTAGFSIKSYRGGSVDFTVEKRRYLLRPSRYLLVNAGQPYAFTTQGDPDLSNVTLFLDEELLGEIWHQFVDEEALTDDPQRRAPLPEFEADSYALDPRIGAAQDRLFAAWKSGPVSPSLIDRQLEQAAEAVLLAQLRVRDEIGRIGTVRAATRREIHRRIRRAIEFVEESDAGRISVESMADAACMARFHFHRRFRDVTGSTPYQFVLRHRMDKAADLIAQR